MIPVAALKPIVDRWLLEFDSPEVAYHRLAAVTDLKADTWRKRLSAATFEGPRGTWRGWWSLDAIDVANADELLTAMGLPQAWEHELAAYDRPALEHVSAKVRLPGERGRVKRLSKASLLTREQIFAVHKLHLDGGLSMREIARRGHKQWGYASEKSCLNALCDLLDSYGLKRRDRIDATLLASTTHGRGSRDNKAAYKRWHRRAFGAWASDTRAGGLVRKARGERHGVVCAGVKKNAPGRGKPCSRYALHDSLFCFNHDPRHEKANAERLAVMRSRIGVAA